MTMLLLVSRPRFLFKHLHQQLTLSASQSFLLLIGKVLLEINPVSVNGFITEATLLSTCSHPSIVQLIGVCFDPREPTLVLEYAR